MARQAGENERQTHPRHRNTPGYSHSLGILAICGYCGRMAKSIKQKKCRICKEKFTPFQFAQVVCTNNGYACAKAYAHQQREKQVKKEKKEFNAETRRMKEAIKTKPQLTKAAQIPFNKFIRLRDRDEPCISCGRTNAEVEGTDGWKVGGAWDCGHFLAIGSHPELRFEEKNAYKQCKSCNGGSGKYTGKNHTVAEEYERRLRERVGDEDVDWLKSKHEARNDTHDDLREIKATYSAKARELEKEINT